MCWKYVRYWPLHYNCVSNYQYWDTSPPPPVVKVSPHRRTICSFVCLISIISQELIIKLLFRGPQQINICDWGYLAHQNKSRWRKVEEGGGGGLAWLLAPVWRGLWRRAGTARWAGPVSSQCWGAGEQTGGHWTWPSLTSLTSYHNTQSVIRRTSWRSWWRWWWWWRWWRWWRVATYYKVCSDVVVSYLVYIVFTWDWLVVIGACDQQVIVIIKLCRAPQQTQQLVEVVATRNLSTLAPHIVLRSEECPVRPPL